MYKQLTKNKMFLYNVCYLKKFNPIKQKIYYTRAKITPLIIIFHKQIKHYNKNLNQFHNHNLPYKKNTNR